MGAREIPWDESVAIQSAPTPSFIPFLGDDTYENKLDRRHALHMACLAAGHDYVENILEYADEFYGWLQSVAVEPGGLEDEAAASPEDEG